MVDIQNITHENIDVLIIGGGLAGTFASIKAKEAGARKVVQVDKAYTGRSGCSALSAGVIRTFFPKEDSWDAVFKDGVIQTHYLCDQERLEDHLNDIEKRIEDMVSYGVSFERTPDGKLERFYGRSGAMRVMFHGGLQMMGAMRKAAVVRGVEHIDRVMITSLLKRDRTVVGAIGFHIETGEFHIFQSKAVVIAMGRCWNKGRLPGHRNVTGDGFVIASAVGAELCGFERARWNNMPAHYDIGPGMSMFVGSGGFFVNRKSERFMEKFDPILGDRAQLFWLTNYFAMEAKRGNAPIYLDMTHLETDKVARLKRVVPLPMMMFERVGIVKDNNILHKIEIVPAGTQCEGGIKINRRYESTISGLYACGDSIPGAGEEALQSVLPGATTSGSRAGTYAADYAREAPHLELDQAELQDLKKYTYEPLARKTGMEPDQVLLTLQEVMTPYDVLIIRHDERMQQALKDVEDIWENQVQYLCAYNPHYLRMAIEARNIVWVAKMQLRCALFRTESRTNLREDFPFMDNVNWLKWIVVRRNNSELELLTEEIPVERYPVKPTPGVVLHPQWETARSLGIIKIDQGHIKWA